MAHSRSNADSSTPGSEDALNVVGMVTAVNPLYLRFLSRSSSLLVMTGCLAFTTLQSFGVGSRMF